MQIVTLNGNIRYRGDVLAYGLNQYSKNCLGCIYFNRDKRTESGQRNIGTCILGKCNPNCREKVIKQSIKKCSEKYSKAFSNLAKK
jgi:hypothetical protein